MRISVLLFSLLIPLAVACSDEGSSDGGMDATTDGGTCECCGTTVLINPGQRCDNPAVCEPYCMGDVGPDTRPPRDTSPSDSATDTMGDTGPADTGPADTGPADTGPADTGPADTGPADAGDAAP